MDQRSERSAASRAQWLAELALAIQEAQRLAWMLSAHSGHSAEGKELHARIEAARLEIDSLRRGRLAPPREGNDPFRTSFQPWSPAAPDKSN